MSDLTLEQRARLEANIAYLLGGTNPDPYPGAPGDALAARDITQVLASHDARGERIEALTVEHNAVAAVLCVIACFASDRGFRWSAMTDKRESAHAVVELIDDLLADLGVKPATTMDVRRVLDAQEADPDLDMRAALAALAQSPSAPQGKGKSTKPNTSHWWEESAEAHQSPFPRLSGEGVSVNAEGEAGAAVSLPTEPIEIPGHGIGSEWTPPPTEPDAVEGGVAQNFVDGDPAVHRVCEVIKGDCKRCPASETLGSYEDTTRGCYLQARECVNTVETGNPWRKTENVRVPFVALAPLPADIAALVERMRQAIDGYSNPSTDEWREARLKVSDVWFAADRLSAALEQSARRVSGPGGIYVASRASVLERGAMWRRHRDAGAPIISSWIDEDGPGETADMGQLWARILDEIARCEFLCLYVELTDVPLRGALVEVGAALMLGKPVRVVSSVVGGNERMLGSWIKHSLVSFVETVDLALFNQHAGAPEA